MPDSNSFTRSDALGYCLSPLRGVLWERTTRDLIKAMKIAQFWVRKFKGPDDLRKVD